MLRKLGLRITNISEICGITNDEISILGKENAIAEKDVTNSVTEGVDDSLDEFTHYVNFVLRQLRYNRLTDDEYIKYADNYLGIDGKDTLALRSNVKKSEIFPSVTAPKKSEEMSKKLKDILSGKTKRDKKSFFSTKSNDTNETTSSEENETINSTTTE